MSGQSLRVGDRAVERYMHPEGMTLNFLFADGKLWKDPHHTLTKLKESKKRISSYVV